MKNNINSLFLSSKLASLLALLVLISSCAASGEVAKQRYADDCGQAAECQKQRLLTECAATANRYPYSRDRLLYDEYGALFTQDAVFQIEGGPISRGRAAIVDALRLRGPKALTRHYNKVVQMQSTGKNTAVGISYVTVWMRSAEQMQAGDNSVEAPFVVGEYHDNFRWQDGRCLIAKRLVKIVFRGAN